MGKFYVTFRGCYSQRLNSFLAYSEKRGDRRRHFMSNGQAVVVVVVVASNEPQERKDAVAIMQMRTGTKLLCRLYM